MKPAVHVITLAVADLERALAFYRALGLESSGIRGAEFVGDERNPGGAVAMFQMQGGLILALYGRDDLAKDAGIRTDGPASAEFSIGHVVPDREDVTALLADAVAAGAEQLAGPQDRPWGIHSAYFRDPDGHLWEIIWTPDAGLTAP